MAARGKEEEEGMWEPLNMWAPVPSHRKPPSKPTRDKKKKNRKLRDVEYQVLKIRDESES